MIANLLCLPFNCTWSEFYRSQTDPVLFPKAFCFFPRLCPLTYFTDLHVSETKLNATITVISLSKKYLKSVKINSGFPDSETSLFVAELSLQVLMRYTRRKSDEKREGTFSKPYGVRLAPTGDTGSYLFTEVEPKFGRSFAEMVTEWETILENPVLYFSGSQAGVLSDHQSRLSSLLNVG